MICRRKLFSSSSAFYEAHAPTDRARHAVDPRPDPDHQGENHAGGFGRKLVGELWMYPDGSQIVELSTKAKPSRRSRWRRRRGRSCLSLGVDLTSEQQTRPRPRSSSSRVRAEGRRHDDRTGPAAGARVRQARLPRRDHRRVRRLRENDTVRVIDALVVFKDAEGDVAVLKGNQLSKDEAEEFGAVVGGLLGLGAGGEEGMEAGAIAARRPRRTASTCSTRKRRGRPGRAALRCRGRAHPARASLGDRAARRDRARRLPHRRTLHQSPRSDRDRPDLRGRGRGARRVRPRCVVDAHEGGTGMMPARRVARRTSRRTSRRMADSQSEPGGSATAAAPRRRTTWRRSSSSPR